MNRERSALPLAALLFAILLATASAAAPPIVFSVKPTEPDANGSLVYAVMSPETGNSPATGRFWVSVKFSNPLGVDLRLHKIRLVFLTNSIPILRDFPRDKVVEPGKTLEDGLIDEETSSGIDEIVVLSLPAPHSVVVGLYFDGYTDPVTVQRPLAPYVPSVPGGKYLYPADEGDLGPGEYFSDSHAHGTSATDGIGGQHWGADWKVYRLLGGGDSSTVRIGGDPAVNADHLGWGIPIRALADGIVLRTSTGWINNPTAGTRALQKLSEYEGEAIQDVKVTRLGPWDRNKPQPIDPARAVSLTRLPAGNFQLSVWDLTTDSGRQLTRLGSSLPEDSTELVTHIAIDELADDPEPDFTVLRRVVTTFRMTNGTLRAVLWDISADGLTVERLGQADWVLGDFSEMSLMTMSASRIAVAVRDAGGNLRVSVWEVLGDNLYLRVADTAGGATSVNVTALSDSRIVASMRASNGNLKLIVWDYVVRIGPLYTLPRRGEADGEAITRVVAAKTVHKVDDVSVAACVTTLRTAAGFLRIMRWVPTANGAALAAEAAVTGNAILDSSLALCRASGDGAASVSLLANGTFKINGWGSPDPTASPPETTYQFSAQNQDSAVNRASIEEISHVRFLVGTRTPGGALKMMVWNWAHGGGNSVYVLHGDCRVLYAHFQEGSVDTEVIRPGATVLAGQMLGRMGNSGASGAPHTHIHSDRLASVYDLDQMILDEASVNRIPDIGPRPLPFSNARAMKLSDIAPGGETSAANNFVTMNGHGMYDVSLGIRPRMNTRYVAHGLANVAPNGFKDMLPNLNGGPWRAVGDALSNSSSGTRLYIRGGNYQEGVIFTTPMTIRRYDFYDADGSAVIQR